MSHSKSEVEELVACFPGVQEGEEGGTRYFLLPKLELPEGCTPRRCDALLCPTNAHGYPSRLFFAEHISSPTSRNWNASNVRILERNWFAISWRIREGLRLAQMVRAHLEAFR